jgi:hypothetical protein
MIAKEESKKSFDQSQALMKIYLKPTNPLRLGLQLSTAVFTYEIYGNAAEAIKIAS